MDNDGTARAELAQLAQRLEQLAQLLNEPVEPQDDPPIELVREAGECSARAGSVLAAALREAASGSAEVAAEADRSW